MKKYIIIILSFCATMLTGQSFFTDFNPPVGAVDGDFWRNDLTDTVQFYQSGDWNFAYVIRNPEKSKRITTTTTLSSFDRTIYASADTIFLPPVDSVREGKIFEITAWGGTTAISPVRVVTTELNKLNNTNSMSMTNAYQTIIVRLIRQINNQLMYVVKTKND